MTAHFSIQKGSKMTPAKKAVPALSDLLKDNKDDQEKVNSSATEKETTPDADDTFMDPDENDLSGVSLVDPSSTPVPTWKENHEHNLAKVHPDVIPAAPPSEHAKVTTVATETVYAEPAEYDDKGRNV